MDVRGLDLGRAPTGVGRRRALRSQIGRLERRLSRLDRASSRVSWIRLGIVVAGALAAGVALGTVGTWLAGLCVVATGFLFGVAVYLHNRVDRSIARHQIWREMRSAAVARAHLDWERIPAARSARPTSDHPFELDLDLSGPRSLHQVLDAAVSLEGSERLRSWLTAPVPVLAETLRRQRLVRELVPLRRFRDRLTLNATLVAGRDRNWRAGDLVRWLQPNPADGYLGRWTALLALLAALNAALFGANQLGLLPALWQLSFLVYAGLTLSRLSAIAGIWNDGVKLQSAFWQLRTVFRQLEAFSYRDAPDLGTLCAPFRDRAVRPSSELARVSRLLAALGIRGNPLIDFAINAVLPWDIFFAWRLSRRKAALAELIPKWMDVWFELEALSSLAHAADLHPERAFPRVVSEEEKREFVFRAEAIGHPLIAEDRRITNDFTVSRLGQVTLISGSNMSGKSAFLKTIGVNLVLAYAGGTVVARDLETIPCRLFTCMNVSDSVTDGFSFFFAEVRRLRELLTELEAENPLPLIYCIDEMFRGTNNRERLIGGRAYLRALVGERGVGFVATHDLELAGLADEMPAIGNYHFRDSVVGDRMAFDYTLRMGPCPTTNALKIMRMQGLPVPTVEEGL